MLTYKFWLQNFVLTCGIVGGCCPVGTELTRVEEQFILLIPLKTTSFSGPTI